MLLSASLLLWLARDLIVRVPQFFVFFVSFVSFVFVVKKPGALCVP